jgi:probable addiction module antidote protein
VSEIDMRTQRNISGQPEVEKLRANRRFANKCTKAAVESLNDPDERGMGLATLRALAEAYGGLGAVAKQAGISRESLYRSLSPKGNPTLKTLIAVVNTMGLRLTVVEAPTKKKKRTKSKDTRIAA